MQSKTVSILGHWRGFLDDVVYAFLDCGDQAHGFARVYCDACRSEYLITRAFSPPLTDGYVERVIGTIRRECLDHVIIFNTGHLPRVLDEYVTYYNESRTHLGIDRDCTVPRSIQFFDDGEIVAMPVLGGLHHTYRRRATQSWRSSR